MFNKFIRKPKGTKAGSRQAEDDAPAASGGMAMAMATEARLLGNFMVLSSCNRCNIDHLAKDCPSKQAASNEMLVTGTRLFLLPGLREVPSAERPLLFRKKLALCSVVYDFTATSKDTEEKEIKKQTLSELVDYVTTVGTGKLNEAMLEDMFRMICINLFRSLPIAGHDPAIGGDGFDAEEEEAILDPAWVHIQLVYDFLLHYLIHQETDAKIAKRYVNHSFVLHLLDLFDSEDPRERDYLKTVLHRIYGKFMVLRPFVRKAINNIFYRFIFETEKHNGIGEMLEILGSIINGFALPLKEEHKLFLVRALIPLHKPKSLGMYHQQLTYCVMQFVEKDLKLADTVIRGLLKYWPITNSQKEVLMLGEVEEVLEIAQPAEFQRCMVPLFRQICRCLNSPHFQVAEHALLLWNSDHVVGLIAQNRMVILPLIFSALEKNSNSHWNPVVHGLISNVRKMFQELDANLFNECLKDYQDKELNANILQEQRDAVWKRLEAAAAAAAAANTSTVNLVMVT